MNENLTRRGFVAAAAAGGVLPAAAKPALLGGPPVRTGRWPSWPVFGQAEEQALLDVLRSGKWFRGYGQQARRFEEAYAKLTGAAYCVATANGTSALYTSLNALGVGPGHEVLLPPFTFVATVNVILMQHALPVFIDSDPETFLIDAHKIEAAITPRTAAIIPVHMGGSAADLDAILAIARKRNVPVIEDACQAHLGEWRGRKLGAWGDTGCFSFQASKNLNSGEGGAILTNSEALADACRSFHDQGRNRKPGGPAYIRNGSNLRMTEFQAALLMAQMTRLEEQSRLRDQNAQYLSSLLREIPGMHPARVHSGCTRHAWHVFMFRYRSEECANLPRARFLKALAAEGIPAHAGYTPLNQQPYLRNALQSRAYRAIYPAEVLAQWEERNRCPGNDRLCEQAVHLSQNVLLGSRGDMDQIAEAVRKVKTYAGELARA